LTAKQLETVRAINKANREFWATPEANATARRFAELDSQIAVQAGRERASRVKGTRRSAEARKHIERDRRIHDAHASGKAVKQIAGDQKICGKKKLSASQIRRILQAPRP
jgi:hypothetical protein